MSKFDFSRLKDENTKKVDELFKKIENFIDGKRKTSSSLLKPILNFSEVELDYLHHRLKSNLQRYKGYTKKGFGFSSLNNCDEVIQRFHELKPEYKGRYVPIQTIEENQRKKIEVADKKKKEVSGFSFDDFKDMLFFSTIILLIISFIIFLFVGPSTSDELKCYMINGEKVCKYESDWEKIRGNFEDSVRNIPYDK